MKMVISQIVMLNPCLLMIAKGIAKIKVSEALPNNISFNVFSINLSKFSFILSVKLVLALKAPC